MPEPTTPMGQSASAVRVCAGWCKSPLPLGSWIYEGKHYATSSLRGHSMIASDRLYRVKVKGGGAFLYDTIDVARFANRMAAQGDHRPFTVKPWTCWRRAVYRWTGWGIEW